MNSFFSSFCKVEFVCYQGEPNWLGWLILIPFVLVIGIFVIGFVVNNIFDPIEKILFEFDHSK